MTAPATHGNGHSSSSKPVLDLARPPAAVLESDWFTRLRRWVSSGEQVFEIVGTEPQAALEGVRAISRLSKLPLVCWDYAAGVIVYGDARGSLARRLQEFGKEHGGDPEIRNPETVLRAVTELIVPDGPSFHTVLLNYYAFFGDEAVRQRLESAVMRNSLCQTQTLDDGSLVRLERPIFFIQSPFSALDLRGVEAIRHWFVPAPFPLPTAAEIHDNQLAQLVRTLQQMPEQHDSSFEPEFLRTVATACRGLERHRVTSALYFAVQEQRGLSPRVPTLVRREVARQLATTSALEVIDAGEIRPPEQLGGVTNVIRALERAARTFTPAAAAQHLDPARGVWFCGLPGTGKSELAKAAVPVFERVTGRPWQGLRINAGAIYGGVVGATEQAWLDIVRRIAAFGADTIVWIDELDKVFDTRSAASSDVTQSLLGMMLGWMSDPKRQCYLILAMNAIDGIPAPLLRDGRVDAGFFFDLPTAAVRAEILQIHFRSRLARGGQDLDVLGFAADQWATLAEETDQWIPSELERLVIEGRDVAFEARGVALPTFAELLAIIAAKRSAVLAVQKKAELDALRRSCAHARRTDVDAPVQVVAPALAGPAGPRTLDLDLGAAPR